MIGSRSTKFLTHISQKMNPNELRKLILETSWKAQAGHIPSAFSILEIVQTLYKHTLSDKDTFVLSKGHGCLALYAVFVEMGIITREEMLTFSSYNSRLGGHPHRNKLKEIFASTGSLGHGLPICVGVALANKISQNNNKVYCLVGDGECNEGTVWESAMLADKLQLNNLVCLVDNNSSQTRSMPTNDIVNKFKSFGWDTRHVRDGHNIDLLISSLSGKHGAPLCVVYDTIKGKGIKEMENNMFAWHHGPPTLEQYELFCEELSA